MDVVFVGVAWHARIAYAGWYGMYMLASGFLQCGDGREKDRACWLKEVIRWDEEGNTCGRHQYKEEDLCKGERTLPTH